MEWKQKLYDATGNADRTPEKLLAYLRQIQTYAPKPAELLIPCDERGHVYCLNHVIRDRRKLLGISQEKLADGICDPRTLSRIECKGGNLQKKNRKELLQRVNMSGERYDYEVITDYYEDYLLRSEIDRAIIAGKYEESKTLLFQLKESVPSLPTNRQYFMKNEAKIMGAQSKCHSLESQKEICTLMKDALFLTLPLNVQNIDEWSTSTLSVNEVLTLISYAFWCKKQHMYEHSLRALTYVKECLESTETDMSYYEDLYTRVVVSIASVLSDLGRYGESDSLILQCMRLSLEDQITRRLPRCLFGIAWNLTHQIPNYPQEERKHKERDAVSLLRQAYAAAILSGNTARQKEISCYCLKVFGEELAF